MKKNYSLIWLILIVLMISHPGLANNTERLSLDRNEKTITAPEGTGYVWTLNEKSIEGDTRSIKISESGTYSVEYTNLSGNKISLKMSLNVAADGTVYRIIMIGDSTMQEWNAGYYPQQGWGAVMQPFFDEANVQVINEARSGRSSKSYYEESDWWPRVRELVEEGDFVLIQFGINDRSVAGPDRTTDPYGSSDTPGSTKYYLKKYVDESIARGAYPILCTTIRRGDLGGYGAYAQASRDLAEEVSVPLIDIDSLNKIDYDAVGTEYATDFWHSDVVHPQEMGCNKIGQAAIHGLQLLGDDPMIAKLIPHIKQFHTITTTTNYPDQVRMTKTDSFPSGTKVNYKVIYDSEELIFVGWFDSDGNRLSIDPLYRFTTGDESMTLEARFDDDFSKIDCSGFYEGGASIDDCGECSGGYTELFPCEHDFMEETTYKIQAVHSGLCLVPGENYLEQQECGSEDIMEWEFVASGDNHYLIKNLGNDQYLSYAGSTSILSAEPLDWRLEKDGDYYRLVPKDNLLSNIAVSGKKETEGAKISVIRRTSESAAHLFSIEDAAGVLGTEALNLRIFPNPVTDAILNIEAGKVIDGARLELVTMDGRKVYEQNISAGKQEILLNQVDPGMYLIRIVNDNKTAYQDRIIVK